jgi:hypothetical protein
MKHELEVVMVAWALQSEANTKQLLADPNGTFEQFMGVKLPPLHEVKVAMEAGEIALMLPPEEVLETLAAIFVGHDTTWPEYWGARGPDRAIPSPPPLPPPPPGPCKTVQDYGTAMAIAISKCEKCKELIYEKCDWKCKLF